MQILNRNYKKILFKTLVILLTIRVSIDYMGLFININLPIFGETSLSKLFALTLIPITILFIFYYQKKVLETPLIQTLFLIIIINVITIPITPISNTISATIESFRVLSIIFIYVLSYISITSYELFKKLIYYIIGTSFISIIFAIIQLISDIGYTDVAFSELRIFGAFTHPNVYGTYLLVIIASILIGLILSKSKKETLFLIVLLGIEFFFLTLTFTRIAWLMGLFIIVSFILIKKRILAIPLFVIIIFSYITIPQIHERITEATILSPDSSLIWRFNLWHDTIFYTISNNDVLFGNGTGTFMEFAENIRGHLFGDLEPHNEFVKTFVENGLLGLIVFIIYIISFTVIFIINITKVKDKTGRNIFFILSILFISLTIASLSDHIFLSTPLQWILMAIIGGAFSITNTTKETEKPSSNNL